MDFLDQVQTVGCVGSREITPDEKLLCIFIGYALARLNIKINSGNANGADAAFAEGANQVNPAIVTLYVPNINHNMNQRHIKNVVIYEHQPEWIELAKRNHVVYDFLKPYVKKLFNRNAGIVMNSQLLIALPSTKKGGGGTGHDIRIAESLNIPCLDISQTEVREELVHYLQQKLK